MSPRNPELQEVLEPQHREAGLSLEEIDDHVILLKKGEDTIAIFSQTGTSAEYIRRAANAHLGRF